MSVYSLFDPTWWDYKKNILLVKINAFIVRTFGPVCFISQAMYLCINYKKLSISTLLSIFSIMPATCLTNTCLFCAQRSCYKNVMKNFMTKIHLHNFKHSNEYVEKQLIKIEHYTRRVTYYLTVCLMSVCTLWIIIPIINNRKNKEEIINKTVIMQTSIYLWMPFDYEYNYKNWIIIHFINSYVAITGSIILIMFNLAFNMVLFHLIGHIKNLKRKLETEFSMPLNEKEVKQKLSALVDYHNFIIRIFEEIQDAFGLNVTGNYCQNLLGDSLILYQIMFGEEGYWLTYGMMLLAYLGSLVLLSFVLEEIRIQSDLLPNTAYNMEWEFMDVSNQKTFVLILARMQPPLEFISAGGLRAGVRPMIAIVKSTFSYYVMLKSTVNS
nr:odorant receptor 59 [Papilio dardanus]